MKNHFEIRACACNAPYRIVLTWMVSGDVWRWDRAINGGEIIADARTMDEFNRILMHYNIDPVGSGRRGGKTSIEKTSGAVRFKWED